jgi:hypothetical protein
MAWAVLGVPPIRHGGLDIAGLAAVSDQIPAPELRAGDALLRTESPAHVALFHEWVDASRLSCWAFEHARGTGTVHRTIDFPHDDAARSFLPRRYRLLTD